jgi:hypothetical protein
MKKTTVPLPPRMTNPQFQAAYAACKTKTQALGCCIEMLSQDGIWSGIDHDVWVKHVLPHKEAFAKLMGKSNEGSGK